MGNPRLLLYLSLGLILFLLWTRWQEWNALPLAEEPQVSSQASQAPAQAPVSADVDPVRDDMPSVVAARDTQAIATPQQSLRQSQSDTLVVTTNLLRVEIDTKGGDVIGLELLEVPVDSEHEDIPYRLLNKHPSRYTIQSGLLHDQTGDVSQDTLSNLAPSHYSDYEIDVSELRLGDGEDTVTATLHWQNDTGITVKKEYTFHRDSYSFDLAHTVRNRSAKTWVGRQYRQIRRAPPTDESVLLYTFTGGAYYDGKYNKVSFEEMDEGELAQTIRGGWVAMLQHYFFSALLADAKTDSDIYTRSVRGDYSREYILGLRSEALRVGPGDTMQFASRIFSGPKIQNQLSDIAPGLELVTDYGIFSVIAKPLFWLLDKFFLLSGNWAVAIILLTILIKLVFYKLSETSYKSMARMRKLQPSIMAMRDRYKDDRQQMQKAMMEFYRREKINPLGGCLPILVQIPVFIALYWVLLESVELRQAPFALWIQDLSVRDPYFVLPLLMGGTMLIQMKLNPTPPDPIQARVMMLMPIIFTAFFAFFPAGLVLYWLVNNVLSIAQQWVINRRIEQS